MVVETNYETLAASAVVSNYMLITIPNILLIRIGEKDEGNACYPKYVVIVVQINII